MPRFQFLTPGAVFGVVAWIVASGGFFFYVSNFSSYSATYGAFAGAVILLVWLWLTNVVLLLGAELNAVIDLRRAPRAAGEVRRAAAAGEGPGGRLADGGGLAQGHRLRPRAERRAAGAVAAEGAVRLGGDGVAALEHALGEPGEALGERGDVADGEAWR